MASNDPQNRPWRRRLGLLATCLLGTAIVGSCGCGPIGLYSLGHSLLVHNHVLKPILPDGAGEAADEGVKETGDEQGMCAPAGSGAQKGSSCGPDVPMEIAHTLPEAACSIGSDESEGN